MDELVRILCDHTATISERDDAAMDLSDYDGAINVLLNFAKNSEENATILASCGVSIAEIWKRLGVYDQTILNQLAKPASDEIKASFA